MKLSNSSVDKYNSCGLAYKYQYIDKWVSKYKGSALYFGSALDEALNELLTSRNLKKSQEIFLMSWTRQKDNTKTLVDLTKNPYVVYFSSDLNLDLLNDEDLTSLNFMRLTLDFQSNQNYINHILELKNNNGYDYLTHEEKEFLAHANWLTLKNKGLMMLETYEKYILPQFKEILDIQIETSLINDGGDVIYSIVDFVARLHDDRIGVFDNKTSSRNYTIDQTRNSYQLGLYKFLLETNNKYKIDVVGYAVLGKKFKMIEKRACVSCKKSCKTKHATCPEVTNEKRCGGDLKVTGIDWEVPHQLLIETLNSDVIENILNRFNDTNEAIQNEIFEPNFESCFSFGQRCPYYSMCHDSGPDNTLIKLEVDKFKETK